MPSVLPLLAERACCNISWFRDPTPRSGSRTSLMPARGSSCAPDRRWTSPGAFGEHTILQSARCMPDQLVLLEDPAKQPFLARSSVAPAQTSHTLDGLAPVQSARVKGTPISLPTHRLHSPVPRVWGHNSEARGSAERPLMAWQNKALELTKPGSTVGGRALPFAPSRASVIESCFAAQRQRSLD